MIIATNKHEIYKGVRSGEADQTCFHVMKGKYNEVRVSKLLKSALLRGGGGGFRRAREGSAYKGICV